MSMGNNDVRVNDPQKRALFKRKRAGVVLTQSEVDEIKAGRKKLRQDMKAAGAYSHKEFELTASSLGLYFDRHRGGGLLLWLFHGRALWALLGAGALLLLALYGISKITELRGHFTINLTDEMFEEGFELSDTADFANVSSRLYGEPVADAPCISIVDIPEDVAAIDGPHNGRAYFAHTFYLAKRGEGAVDYRYTLRINSESMNCSTAIWAMVFRDGKPVLYAKGDAETGDPECLPAKGDDSRGYRAASLPFLSDFPADQYEEIVGERITAYRLMPYAFEDDLVITSQLVEDIAEDEVHKYTIVFWLEGDDPQCTDDLIGSHIGMQMDFQLID